MIRRAIPAAAALALAGLSMFAYAPAAQAATAKQPVNVSFHWSYNAGHLTVTETLTRTMNGKVTPFAGEPVKLVCASPAKSIVDLGTMTTDATGTVTFNGVAVDSSKYAACAVGFPGDAMNGPAVGVFVLPGAASNMGSKSTTVTAPAGAAPAAPAPAAPAPAAAPAAGTPGLANTGGVA